MNSRPNKTGTVSFTSTRRLMFWLMLFVAIVAAGAAWNWNRLVHLPDPDIVIHTESEAVDSAREFLAAAKIDTSDYDISHATYITAERMKGQIVWLIVWLAKPDAKTTNRLSVLVSETGWFSTNERTGSNQGCRIEGAKTNQFNFNIIRNRYTLVPRKEGGKLETPIGGT